MKRKSLVLLLSLVLSFSMLAGCGSNATNANEMLVVDESITEVADESDDEAADQNDDSLTDESQIENANEEVEETAAEANEADAKADDKESAQDIAESSTEEAKTDELQVNMDDVTALDTPVTMYAQSGVNVRKGPDTKYEKVGYLKLNDEISVIGECKSSEWKEVKYKDEIAFVSGSFLGTEQVEVAQPAETAPAQEAAPAQQAPAKQAPAVAQTTTPAASSAGILFIGDSRTAQMRDATGGGKCGWVCAYSAKYSWFESEGIPTADPMIGAGTKVVICMGVNDPGSLYSYANLVNQKAAEWVGRGAKVYYVSVNPVDHPFEDKYEPIETFNATMPGLLSNVAWIDTASVIKQGGFVLEDGIHYDAPGNITIYNMILGCLR